MIIGKSLTIIIAFVLINILFLLLIDSHCINNKYILYDESKNHIEFIPSGWMGDWENINIFSIRCAINPRSGNTCILVKYDPENKTKSGWSGIYWQYPMNNWGNINEYKNLQGAKKLTFWARTDTKGAKVDFGFGGIYTKCPLKTGLIKLTKKWTKYIILIPDNLDISKIIGGFLLIIQAEENQDGCTFYIDDIVYEYD